MYGCRKTNQNLAKISLCARSLEMQHVETVQVFTELTPWYNAFCLVWFWDNSGSFRVLRQFCSEWSVSHVGLIMLSSWHCDRIQFLWREFILRQCCQLCSWKALSFYLITDSCCINSFLLWQRPWWMQFVWYGFYSYSVSSFHFIRLLQWSPGPDWPLEYAWPIQLTSDWCPEGWPAHVLLASLEVTSHLC